MSNLGHYLRTHLTGAAGGIELFSRGSGFDDADARETLLHIRDELVDERRRLLAMTDRVGVHSAPLLGVAAKIGERLGRLKPNGNPLRRTPLTDLVDLETMRVALAGKASGWDGLLAVVDEHDGLDRAELEMLRDQAIRQHDDVSALHARAASAALR